MKLTSRILTAIAIAGVGLPIIYFGAWLLKGLIIILSLLLGWEAGKLRAFKQPLMVSLLVIAALISLTFVSDGIVVYVIGFWLLLIFFLPYWDFDYKLLDILTLLTMVLLVALGFRAVIALRERNMMLVYLVILTAILTDTFAFFIGSFLGKHKLAPQISPNKTIEGSLAGWLGAGIFAFLFNYFTKLSLPFYFVSCFALLSPVVTQIGDLAFSLIKRNYGLKDFSNIFGTHGGVFDRLDSLVFGFILMNFLINVVLG